VAKAGESGFTPAGEPGTWTSPSNCLGSGYVGTPFERIQRENASHAAYLFVVVAIAPFEVVVVTPKCATPGGVDVVHAESTRPETETMTRSATVRDGRVSECTS